MIGTALTESFAFVGRLVTRRNLYTRARLRADALHRPLVVVGAPSSGWVRGRLAQYVCGTANGARGLPCVDVVGCTACGAGPRDVTRVGAIAALDNSVVVFAPYVLEYVGDPTFDRDAPERAMAEMRRAAGDDANVFVARVQGYATVARLATRMHWQIDSAPPDGPFRYHPVVAPRRRIP